MTESPAHSADRPRLRVGIVTHYWLPHMGGIEVMARDQAQALAGRGWEVTVFTSRLRGDPSRAYDGAVQVLRFGCSNLLESRFRVPVPLMAPGMLRALVKAAASLDVLVAHGHVYVGSFYALLASRSARVPLLVVQSSPFVDYGPVLDRIEALADRSVGKAVLERADKVVAISEFTKRFVESVAPRADVMCVVPGVDLERFFPTGEPRNGERPLFLTVRRLVPRSGIDALIRAWIEGGLGRDADLAIAGDGPLRASLMDAAGSDSSVRFTGRLSDGDLTEIYRMADVFVLPTASGEGYGLALAEALASGLPAVVTDAGAQRELVQHGVNGLVVPAGDASALANQLKAVATDVALRKSLTEGSRACRAHIDRIRSIDSLDDVLRQLAAHERA